MSGIAELERDIIKKRCAAGIARAKAKGTRFGRSPVLDGGQRRIIAQRAAQGDSMATIARDYDVGVATIWRALHSA